MKLEKKVLLQSRIIQRLEEENSSLKNEIENLKTELEMERMIPKEGYDKAKTLMVQMMNSKNEYDKLIKEMKEKREKYQNEMNVLSLTTKERNAKIDSVLKVLNKCAI